MSLDVIPGVWTHSLELSLAIFFFILILNSAIHGVAKSQTRLTELN